MSEHVACSNVSQRFGDRAVLDNVTWRLNRGDVVGLVGDSGAGKTTLLRIIAGLDRCSSGSVTVARRKERRDSAIGMVFQNLGLWPHLTALGHLECVLLSGSSTRRQRAATLLADVGLPAAVWSLRPAQLSGGEAQRVALARALATEPELLLLDEPLAQLDSSLRGELLELIGRVAREREMTVVYVTHAWNEVAQLCPHVAVLVAGRLVQTGPFDDVYHRPVSPVAARLTGPVVEIPQQLVAAGLIQCAKAPNELATWRHSADCMLVRAQQLSIVAPSGNCTWRVVACRPDHNGWRLTIENQGHTLHVPSVDPRPCGESVGLKLLVQQPAGAD
jgi:ABC-type sulfate/molybdate transport systems ATPase subunit